MIRINLGKGTTQKGPTKIGKGALAVEIPPGLVNQVKKLSGNAGVVITLAVAVGVAGLMPLITGQVIASLVAKHQEEVKVLQTKIGNLNTEVQKFTPFQKELQSYEEQKKVVTLKEAGKHVLRLAAFNGKQSVERIETVVVKPAPVGMVTATVAATFEAVLVEQKETSAIAQLRFPTDQKGNVATVSHSTAAGPGFEIVKADFAKPIKDHPNIKSAKLQIDPVKHDKVVLTCELVRPSAKAPSVAKGYASHARDWSCNSVAGVPDSQSAVATFHCSSSAARLKSPMAWYICPRRRDASACKALSPSAAVCPKAC